MSLAQYSAVLEASESDSQQHLPRAESFDRPFVISPRLHLYKFIASGVILYPAHCELTSLVYIEIMRALFTDK